MKLPLFLVDDSDVSMFRSKDDLERYVESPDIAGYSVYDSEGTRFSFVPMIEDKNSDFVVPVARVSIDMLSGSPASAELQPILWAFLARSGRDEFPSETDLGQLISEMVRLDWYTR